MADWVPVGDGFIEADVIRWKEPVFKKRRRGKPQLLGERQVTAEVLRDDGGTGWVDLLVRYSEAVSAHIGRNLSDVLLPAKDAVAKRRRGTILRGDPERLAWSDESARASVVASRFPGNSNPAPPVSPAVDEGYPLRWFFNPVSRASKKSPTNRNGNRMARATERRRVGGNLAGRRSFTLARCEGRPCSSASYLQRGNISCERNRHRKAKTAHRRWLGKV
jgi:hypothetical protein